MLESFLDKTPDFQAFVALAVSFICFAIAFHIGHKLGGGNA